MQSFGIPVNLFSVDDSQEWCDWADNLYHVYFEVIDANDSQRNGQALMNALHCVAPEMYETITTERVADPFYVDGLIPACVQRIYQLFVESL